MSSTTIQAIINARLDNSSQLFCIGVSAGKIISLQPTAPQPSATSQVFHNGIWDAQGKIVLPGLIDAHTHLDKNFTPSNNADGTLLGAIQTMSRYKAERSLADIEAKAIQGIRTAISHGVQLLRTHVDIGCEADLDTVRMLVDLRKNFANKIRLDLTALGATDTPANVALMRNAMQLGMDMVGGAPALSNAPQLAIQQAVQLASELGCGLDLHIDEQENIAQLTLEILADLCLEYRFTQPVIASHCCALAFTAPEQLNQLSDKLLQANITIVSLPICNLTLMGHHQYPTPRGIAPIKYLRERGINVAIGSDNVQDPFNPFGDYDPLRSANVACMAGHINREADIAEAIQLVTTNPANALRIQDYGIQVGAAANVCITDADSLGQCITAPPARLATVFNGELIFHQTIARTWN